MNNNYFFYYWTSSHISRISSLRWIFPRFGFHMRLIELTLLDNKLIAVIATLVTVEKTNSGLIETDSKTWIIFPREYTLLIAVVFSFYFSRYVVLIP